jgi:hypothetical protein
MLAVRSNVASVRGRLARFAAQVPGAIAATVRPEVWRERAERTASAVLTGLADPGQQRYVPAFVRSIAAVAVPEGFTLTIRGEAVTAVLDRLGEFRQVAELPLFEAAFAEAKGEAYNVILAWVSSGAKERDERDTVDGVPKTDEEIADRLHEILFGRDDSPAKERARQSLLKPGGKDMDPARPNLVDFAAAQDSTVATGLPAEVAEAWLRAVLAGWRAMIRAELPGEVRRAIRDAAAASGLSGGKPVTEAEYHAARTRFAT